MNIIILPENCKTIFPVNLPNPKDGKLQQYFYDEDNMTLYESVKFNDEYRSWFLDNQLCKEGHFNMLTKIDPIFILLPQIERYANKQFRTLDDICSTFIEEASDDRSIKLDYALSHDIKWNNICETKQIDNELFVRYSESQTLKWLEKKFDKTLKALREDNMLVENGQTPSKITSISHARDLIDIYLPEFISSKFKEHVMNVARSSSNTDITTDLNQPTRKRVGDDDDNDEGRVAKKNITDKTTHHDTPRPKANSNKNVGIMRFFKPNN